MMRLLHAGVENTVIALWLGHETTRTTDVYLHADLALKQRAIDRTARPGRSLAAIDRRTRSSRSSKASEPRMSCGRERAPPIT